MLSLQPLSAEQILLLCGVVIALMLISWRFNSYIDAQVETDPLGAYSAVYTVLGVTYTLAGAMVLLTILLGWQLALFAIATIFVCFGVAGTPMIFGDLRRGGRRRREQLRGKSISNIEE